MRSKPTLNMVSLEPQPLLRRRKYARKSRREVLAKNLDIDCYLFAAVFRNVLHTKKSKRYFKNVERNLYKYGLFLKPLADLREFQNSFSVS